MSLTGFIRGIIEVELEGSDHFLVDVESNTPETKLTFYIDGVSGVKIGVCSKLSKKVSRAIEESEFVETKFRYEVSSPGVDRSLVDWRQYNQHIGRKLNIVLASGKAYEGVLRSANEEEVTIEMEKEKVKLKLKNIETAKVLVSFK